MKFSKRNTSKKERLIMVRWIMLFLMILHFSAAAQFKPETVYNFKSAVDVLNKWDELEAQTSGVYVKLSPEEWIESFEYYSKLPPCDKDLQVRDRVNFYLGCLYHTSTQFSKAIPYLTKLANKKNKLANADYELLLLKLEESYIRLGDLKPAIEIRKRRVREGLANNFWELYSEAGLYEEAIKDFKATESFPLDKPFYQILYYRDLGDLFFKNEQLDSAESNFIRGYKVGVSIQNNTNYKGKYPYSEYTKHYYRSLMMGNIAEIYILRGQYIKAIPLLNENIEKSKSIKEISNAMLKRLDLVECYLNLKDYKLAKLYLDTVSDLIKTTKIYFYDFRFLKLKADYFFAVKQFDSAAVNLSKYLAAKDTIDERLRRNNAIGLIAIFDTDKQKAMVAEQKLELAAAKANEAESRANRNLLIAAVLVLLILVVWMLFYSRQRNKRRVEIENSLKEKEFLIKEIHHRVKNNLTTLKSLLFLQAKSSDSEEVKNVLNECQMRIQSMALIHQNLYQESENEKVEFQHFITQLFEALDLSLKPSNLDVELEIDIDSVSLDMSKALFFGLIINELVTNSYKYAFKNKNNGIIKFRLSIVNNKIVAQYSDNGIGLPKPFEEIKDGFGFRLIRILIDQINGELNYAFINNLSIFTITVDV